MPVCGCPAGDSPPPNQTVNESCDGTYHCVTNFNVWHYPIWQYSRKCNKECIVYKALHNFKGAQKNVCKPFSSTPLRDQNGNRQPEVVDLTSDTEDQEQERIRNNHRHVEPDRNVTENGLAGLNRTVTTVEFLRMPVTIDDDEADGGAAVTESDAAKKLDGGSASGARPEHKGANQLRKAKHKSGRKACVHAATQTMVCNQPTNSPDTSSSQSNTSSPQKPSKAKTYPRLSSRKRLLAVVAPTLAKLRAMHHRHRHRRYHHRRRSNVVGSDNLLTADSMHGRTNVIRTGPGVTNGAIHGPNSNTTNIQSGSDNTSSPNAGSSNVNQNGPSKPRREDTINTEGGSNNAGSTIVSSSNVNQNGPSKPRREDTIKTQGGSNNAGSTTASSSNVIQNGPSKLRREDTMKTQGDSNNAGSTISGSSNVNQNGPCKPRREDSFNTQGGSNNTGSTTANSSNVIQNGPSKPRREDTIKTQGDSNSAGSTTADSSNVKQNDPSNARRENSFPSGKMHQPIAFIKKSGNRIRAFITMDIPSDCSCPRIPMSLPFGDFGPLYPVSLRFEVDNSYPSSTVTTNDSPPTNTVTTSGSHPSATVTKSGRQPNVTAFTNFNRVTVTFTTIGDHPKSGISRNDISPNTTVTRSGGVPVAAITRNDRGPTSTFTRNNSGPTSTITRNDSGQTATVTRNYSGPSVITTKGSSNPSVVINNNDSTPSTINNKNINGSSANIIKNGNVQNGTITGNDSGQRDTVIGNGSGQRATVAGNINDSSTTTTSNASVPITYFIGKIGGPNATTATSTSGQSREDNLTGDQQNATITGNSNGSSTTISRNGNFPVTFFFGKPNDTSATKRSGQIGEDDLTSEQKSILSDFEHFAKHLSLLTPAADMREYGKVIVGTYPIVNTTNTGVCATNSAVDSNIGTNINFRSDSVISTTTWKNGNCTAMPKSDSGLSSTNWTSASVTNASTPNICNNISSDNSKDSDVASNNSSYGKGITTISATNSVMDRNSSTSRSECVTSTTMSKNTSCTVMPRSDGGLSSTNCRSASVTNSNTPNIHNNISRDNSESCNVAQTNSSYGKCNVTTGASNSAMDGNCSISINSRSECVASSTVSKNGSSAAMTTSDSGLSSINCRSVSVTNANKPNICNNTSSDNAQGSNHTSFYSSYRELNSTIGSIIVSPRKDSSKRESISDGCSTATSIVASNNRNDSNTDNMSGDVINVKTANRNNEHPNGDHSGIDSELSDTKFNFDGVQKSLIRNSAGNESSSDGKNDNRTNSARSSNNIDESNRDGNESDTMSSDDNYNDSIVAKKLRSPSAIHNSGTNECDTSGAVDKDGEDYDDDNDEEEYDDHDANNGVDDDDEYDGDDDDDDDDDNDDGDTDDGPDDDEDDDDDYDDDDDDDDDDEGESSSHRNKDNLTEGNTESEGDCGSNDMPDSSGSFAENNDASEGGDYTSTNISGTPASARDSNNDSDVSSYSHGSNKRSNMSVDDNNAKRIKLEPAANLDFERMQAESSEYNSIDYIDLTGD